MQKKKRKQQKIDAEKKKKTNKKRTKIIKKEKPKEITYTQEQIKIVLLTIGFVREQTKNQSGNKSINYKMLRAFVAFVGWDERIADWKHKYPVKRAIPKVIPTATTTLKQKEKKKTNKGIRNKINKEKPKQNTYNYEVNIWLLTIGFVREHTKNQYENIPIAKLTAFVGWDECIADWKHEYPATSAIPNVAPTVTTTTPTTVPNTQPCKLNSSSCTTKIATSATTTSDMAIVPGKIISKALIVLISIEQYFGEKENSNKCADLTSARMDTQHIIELYADKYEYNIITNKHKYCKLQELKNLLREAQGEFSKGDYQCIFVIFSGHGTKDKLILSDYYDINGNKDVGIYYKYNTMDRTELECYFNGDNVTNKADKLKVYIMDACRGSDDAVPIINDEDDRKCTGVEQRGNQQNIKNRKGLHANENRIIFYPNTEPYAAYGYKESGGILINGLYQTMIDDANMDKNLDEIGDIIKDKVEADLVPVLDNGKIIGEFTVKIEIKTTMKSRNMREIYFVKSEDKNKERIKTLNELNKDLNLLYV